MYEQIALQQILNEKLAEARVRNPSYSLRAFSQKLGCSSAALSEILNGKRRVSKKMAARILARLNVSADVVIKTLDLFGDETRVSKTGLSRKELSASQDKAKKALQLKAYEFEMISSWQHFAILALMETGDFVSDPEWIARRLGIAASSVKKALERLEALGAIEARKGKFIFKGIHYRTTDGESSAAIRNFHSNVLDQARNSLEKDPLEARDFTATTMAINVKNLSKAQEIIRSFKKQMSALLESGEQTEAYIFSTQLFPVSRREK